MVKFRILAPAITLAFICTFCARGEIFRWTDENGQVQLSDRPPPSVGSGAERLSARLEGKSPFSFEIIPVDYPMPHDTRVKVEVAVSKIHEILRSRLGLRFRSDPSFDIRIFGDQDSYANYAGGPPLAGFAAGYYRMDRNEAVTWHQNSFQKMLEVITHESNHALMHHRFGEVPPWLNEGLSEYFERMEVFGMAVVIHPNHEWDATVKQMVRDGTIPPLREYLTLSQRGWALHNHLDNRSYAQAWSIIHFLMSTPEGTRLLGHLLATLSRVGADDFSGPDVIDASYDGGLASLETRWRAWALGPKQAHYY